MAEIFKVPFTEIVSVLPQPVLRTSTEAEADFRTIQTFIRKAVHFMHAKASILLHQHIKTLLHDVAKPVIGKGISVAGMLSTTGRNCIQSVHSRRKRYTSAGAS